MSRKDDDPNTVAPGVKIDAYPTEEKYGFIWAFLGDEPDNAAPIVEIPEFDDESFRSGTHSEVWQTNFHWAKFANLDLVHLPVVHGIKFQNQDNPYAPPPFELTESEHGFTNVYYPSAGIRKGGEWEKLREDGKPQTVESVLEFHISGLLLHGSRYSIRMALD